MKYLFGTITTLLVILSFTNRKCEHVFTQVEQPVIKIEHPGFSGAILSVHIYKSGLQEGKELICVKCFHIQKQKIDYGQPEQIGSLVWPQTSPLNGVYDTVLSKTMGSMGSLILKVDTLRWSKVEPVK